MNIFLPQFLGDTPQNVETNFEVRVLNKQMIKEYTLEKLMLDINGIKSVLAYFVYPTNKDNVSLVLSNHSHDGNFKIGKHELLNSSDYL